jgi:hypothetical protein
MLISNSRLVTYAKHAKVTHAINDITSCHDYKVVNIIQESSYQPYTSSRVYVWCLENKLHPYPRVSRRFKSIVTLQEKNNLTTRHTWATKATQVSTFHDDYQRVETGPYLALVPSSTWKPRWVVRGWPEHCPFNHPWSEVRYHPTRRPLKATKFARTHITHMRLYIIDACCRGQLTWSLIDTGKGYHIWKFEYENIPLSLPPIRYSPLFPSYPVRSWINQQEPVAKIIHIEPPLW